MSSIKTVAVFCGSMPGAAPYFAAAAHAMGQGLAKAGIRLVYGGGRIGLMGAVADGAIAAGGEVVGVIPDFLTRLEVAHDGVSALHVTDSMHSRKFRMFDMADVFVTLPGGLGTLDETIEIVTWKQLRLHNKPILICDVEGSSSGFVGAVEQAIHLGFARPSVRSLFEVTMGVDGTLERLASL